MSAPHNPPAFPVGCDHDKEGMTLRDWFAGQHLTTLPEFHHVAACDDDELREVAVQIYRMADAMLAAREGGAS